ncbi:hypothetical protein OKA05_29210 [Luteolibacter arcticus]|uniref:Uncharacterized protein n=1 Tax=Luteolibacter arcticus TaxID=1581411 RepID=A0ABT3GT34_9BACT|nr:hypothetical protein [Luteolibacter arcticus]MCW1926663.1 hypothetical protein [Luteolibacter arcticus]
MMRTMVTSGFAVVGVMALSGGLATVARAEADANEAGPAGKAKVEAVAVAAVKVEVKDGKIVLRTAAGVVRELTTSGRDAAPVLSPDGEWVVFVRAVPGRKISTGSGEEDAAELWQVRADGKEPTLLVSPRDAEEVKDVVATFHGAQFSADGRLVYYMTPAWATSGAVRVVDTTNRKDRFLMAGNTLRVIHAGKYRDHLLVMQRRYFLGGGSYDWYWLFQADGKEVGPVGEEMEGFEELYLEGAGEAEER